jgi:amino acid adenylation domain-containing protein
MSRAEREQLLTAWNRTAVPYPRDARIPDLFGEQVRLRPDAVALVSDSVSWTYRELDERSDRVAERLRRLGVTPDTPVGICTERSAAMIAGILGILKAAGAYVPLDPAHPPARRDLLIHETQPAAILVESKQRGRMGGGPGPSPPPLLDLDPSDEDVTAVGHRVAVADSGAYRTGAEDLAVLLFTSGSTGAPKGVAISHRAIVRLVRGGAFMQWDSDVTCLFLAPLSFDTSLLEIWGTLLGGGRLIVAPPGAPSIQDLRSLIERHGINTLMLATGLFHVVAEADPAMLGPLRQLEVGGEAMSPVHARKALAEMKNGVLINGYGPTECTTVATSHVVTRADADRVRMPIGRPIGNTTAYVLNDARESVPIGEEGELYLGGDGLARGYWRRPDLTAERFVPHPFSSDPEARLYRTGDVACWNRDGTLDFLGRKDDQVKVNGFRIEPAEVEAAILAHPDAGQVAVVAAPRHSSDGAAVRGARLVAFVAPRLGLDAATAGLATELRAFVSRVLPDHLVPEQIHILARLPLTANGKIDRNALAVKRLAERSIPTQYRKPSGPIEALIATIWEEVLQVQPVGADDSFFELGGRSLLMIEAQRRLAERLPTAPPIAVLFQYPTPRGLADALGRSASRSSGLAGPTSAESDLRERAQLQRDAMRRFRPR